MQARAGGVRGEADRVLKVRGGGQRTDRPTGDTEATRNAHYCGIQPEPFRASLRLPTSPERGGFLAGEARVKRLPSQGSWQSASEA